MTHTKEKYADKINKLLRKAESTTPEEAELLVAKAQELITEYAIDEALLAAAAGVEREEIVEETIEYTGVYRSALYDIGATIARNNDCKVLISNGRTTTTMYVIGHKSDVDRVRMLDSSLQIQAVGQLTKWWATRDAGWMTASMKYRNRRQFLFSFAHGLNEQLMIAAKCGREVSTQKAASRSGGTERALADATESVALVVRDKKKRVDEWMDQKYGKTIRHVSRNYTGGGASAASAGRQAGLSANASSGSGVGGAAPAGALGR